MHPALCHPFPFVYPDIINDKHEDLLNPIT